ncbi:surface lipoprotein assembly modifier [Rhodovulum adriaticum]|nr:surface lipoprotein assembly modifier [Rhodovulum adriaticum]
MRHLAGAGALATGLMAGIAGWAGEKVTLTPAEMHAATAHALTVGDHQMALRLAEALLVRDPQDGQALAARARALRNLGRPDEARAAARTAWAQADTDAERYAAALLTAQALSSMGRHTSAQFWLRRAGQNAPTPAARARAARDFRYVRSRNPWSAHLGFGVTPSSNVNGGSSADRINIGGLPFVLSPSARALSGTEITGEAELRYRLRPSETLQLHVEGHMEARAYRLSDGARARAPGLQNGDLAWQAAEVAVGGYWAASPGAGPFGAELTFGKSYYGGDPLADYARLDLSKRFALAPGTILRLSGALEEQWRHDATINDATVTGGTAEIIRRRENGDMVNLSLELSDTTSDSATIAHEAAAFGVDYQLAKPVLGARLSLSAAYEHRDYDRGLFGAAPRTDDRISLGASVFLPEVSYYGFAPEVGLQAQRVNSNQPLYRSEELGLTLGFRSTF